MKKTVLLLAMTLVSSFAFGQIQKGDVQLGGSLNYSNFEAGGQETTNFRLVPRAALFLSDNTSLGVSLGYEDQSSGGIETNQFFFGVYARFHKSVSDKFYLFLQPDVSFGSGTTNPLGNQEFDLNSFNFGLMPGMMYFLSEKIALDMTFAGIFYNNTDTATGGEITRYGLNMNLNAVSVGASIYLR
ncbi:hypothetical protein BFP97_00880 [Roseivirga sp. 4D4]|uniref:outer membrane beta-barrel protein n=1 Tax=Roseivirga sp. 4D4 TaxID=1889784 RepID=UPI000853147A|nr:outer membrane beta-barrel protein [Roseivirga sp. 4D4]OEK00157.1 hypothetical protein BFP97_00880 [Roseivirga sp. 4D4]